MDGAYILTILPSIFEGLVFTLVFWIIVLTSSLLLATLLVILQSYNIPLIKWLINAYTGIIRGTPLLFQLYFVYFGLPILFGLKIDALTTAYLAFIVSWTGYLIEVLRGAISSVDKGQWDAGAVLGMSRKQTMLYVILPQAVASALPSINNQAVSLVYGTSILSVLGLNDILKSARIAVIRDLRLEGFLIAGFFYAIFGALVIFIFRKLELKLNNFKKS